MTHFFSIKEAADYLQVDYKVVYRLVKEGKIPSTRVGWQFRLTEEDLAVYLKAERVKQVAVAESLRTDTGRIRSDGPAGDSSAAAPTNGAGKSAKSEPGAAQEGQVSRLLARQLELNFINRFDEKIASVDTLRHPTSGMLLRVHDWSESHETQEDQETLMRVLNTAFLDRRTLSTTPRNVISRYTLPGESPLVIEGRVFSHLESLCRDGFDSRLADLEDLMVIIDEYEGANRTHQTAFIVGLASPTGWDDSAIAFIAGNDRGKTYRNAAVRLVLVDLRSEAVFFDQNDGITPGFVGLFDLATDAEMLAGLQDQLRAEIDDRSGLILADFARAHGASLELVLDAARELASIDGYRLVPDREEGWILVRV